MYIFIDESGTTNLEGKQGFLVVAFALSSNMDFAEQLVLKIRDKCKAKGQPIKARELKYHDLTPFQREIAVKEINSVYKNFYLCFFDLDKASKQMVTGEYEQHIQTRSIGLVLSKLNKTDMQKQNSIKILMDKKLGQDAQKALKERFQEYFEIKSGVTVKTVSSSRQRGIQLADLIAGAFRAKLMKKSDLFEVDHTRIFQISATDLDHFTADGA